MKFFHIVDDHQLVVPDKIIRRNDLCWKVQLFVDHPNGIFQHYYVPHMELGIDESLVDTKNYNIYQINVITNGEYKCG